MEKINSRGELSIFALGGLGEVGKNMYCLEYQNQIFIVDCGILFPEEHLLGVDYVIPDFTFLEQNQDKIVGLFITHGHEDHIGGIPYLLKKVKIPMIYAAGVTVDMIENKLEEYPELLSSVKITEFKGNYTYNFKSVEVSFIRMNHSIPDAFAISGRTFTDYLLGNANLTVGENTIEVKAIGESNTAPNIDFFKFVPNA